MLSDASLKNLENVHPDLVQLVKDVSLLAPIRVLCGYRDEASQDAALAAGTSKKNWPNSKHNQTPSLAVDICIQPYNPDDLKQCLYLNAYVMGFGTARGLKLRSGADWEGKFSPAANQFPDLFHIELAT